MNVRRITLHLQQYFLASFWTSIPMLEFQYFQIQRFHVKVIVFSDSRYVQLQHVRVPLQKQKE